MSAASHLASYGVTIEQAHEFVLSNLNNPATIFNVAKQFGVTNAMLGEIAGGYSAADVQAFFSARGIDSSVLDGNMPGDDDSGDGGGAELLPEDLAALAALVALNTDTGTLSNAALRAQVIAETGEAAYLEAFDPLGYEGAADGTLSAADLGVSHLGELPATVATLESLFYGTIIKSLRAIDMQEALQMNSFLTANATALEQGDEGVLDDFIDGMVGVFSTPAAPSLFDDAMIATTAVAAGTVFVQLVGMDDNPALFDGLFAGFIA